MRAAAPKELEPTRGGLTIGHAARAAGVSVETVRFYERQALIDRPDTPIAGYRRYDAAAVNTIRFVKRAQDLGFTLREIKDLLTLHHDDCAGARARAQAKLVAVEAKLRDLERMRAALQQLVRTCANARAAHPCPILEALHSGDGPITSGDTVTIARRSETRGAS